MLQRLARWFIFPYGVKGLKNGAREAGEKKIPKFTESAWKLTYYLATEVFVVLITYKEPWFGDTSAFWHGWPYQTVKYVLNTVCPEFLQEIWISQSLHVAMVLILHMSCYTTKLCVSCSGVCCDYCDHLDESVAYEAGYQ